MASTASPHRLTAIGVLTAALALAALLWQLRDVDPEAIWNGIYRVRWGFPLILALGAARFALRARAWSLCVEPPARLTFGDAFAAVLAGDAVGNLTPLGPIVSEPAKAAFVRGRADFGAAITALAVENLFYTLSVAAMIAASTIVLLASTDLPGHLRGTTQIALGVLVMLLAAACVVLWRRPALVSRTLQAVLRRPASSDAGDGGVARVQRLEHDIYSFASRRKDVLAPVLASEVAFHALGVAEIYLTLLFLLDAPAPALHAFVLEGANRLINVIFKFVPLRFGVDEVGTEGLTQILGYALGLGATLAIVRKARLIVFSTIGGVLLVRRGLTTRRLLEDSRLARARDL